MAKGEKKASLRRDSVIRLRLLEVAEDEKIPKLSARFKDESGKVIQTIALEGNESFPVQAGILEKAKYVRIGPSNQDDPKEAVTLRSYQIADIANAGGELVLARKDWLKWWPTIQCVHGHVSHCRPFPWVVESLLSPVSAVSRLGALQASRLTAQTENLAAVTLDRAALGNMIAPIFPWRRCYRVCDGIVEVYRRTCCRQPFIIDDPRIPEIEIDLEEVIPWPWPPDPWPGPWPGPGPGPDPGPFLQPAGEDPFPTELPIFKEGALDERALYASRDLQMLRSLPRADKAMFVEARPYLWWWKCGSGVKVASGTIRLDGTFAICWREGARWLSPNCHDEYAYVVKQIIGGVSVTIYNGVAANQWFHAGDDAHLVSYSWQAISCGNTPGPDIEGNYVYLQDIGSTESHRLNTPASTAWDSVAGSAGANDGLVDAITPDSAALGNGHNSNWGGTLLLRYNFSEGMRALGARYYRISVARANAAGQPVGSRHYLGGNVTWKYDVVIGGSHEIQTQALGPTPIPGRPAVYLIPYEADHDWQSGQYHGALDTTLFTEGKYLVTLELFDASGNRVRPNGTPAVEASDVTAAFSFRRWFQPVGPTAAVPFGALTHLFWWDNRRVEAEILDIRNNGAISSAECQFLTGCGTADFSVGYKAYHPEPKFFLSHSLSWKRGLGSAPGSSGSLTPVPPPPGTPHLNIGPAVTGESRREDFATMLGGHAKCSFAINLHATVKTTNGSSRLSGLDRHVQAAVALEQVPCLLPLAAEATTLVRPGRLPEPVS